MTTTENTVVWKGLLHEAAAGITGAAAVFLFAVLVLLTANRLLIRDVDPLTMDALEAVKAASGRHPRDDELKEAFRALDTGSRTVYYRGLAFQKRGLLLVGVAVVVLIAGLQAVRATRAQPAAAGEVQGGDLEGRHRSQRWGLAGGVAAAVILAAAVIRTHHTDGAGGSAGGHPPPDDAGTSRAESYPAPSAEEMARQWPGFLGPGGLGIAAHATPPTAWDGNAGTGVLWSVEVPRVGYSSAIVWNSRVFVTGADEEARELYCYSADSGDLLWRSAATDIVGSPDELPDVTEDTGWAAPTAATDGVRVVAMFATGDIICTDMDGTRVWARNIGVPENHYGHSSSPRFHKGRVLVQFDHSAGCTFLALDARTGETVWEKTRDVSVSWASPLLVDTGTRVEAILNAEPLVMAYDADSGDLLWQNECMGGEVGPSPAYADGLAFVTTDYAVLAAIRTGGDAEDGTIAWSIEDDLPDVSTPLTLNGRLYVPTSGGVLTCYKAADGTKRWQQLLDKGFYASPVSAAGRVYLMDMGGDTYILQDGEAYSLLGVQSLGVTGVTTPALHGTRIYYRTSDRLYCLGEN